jgi:hypothetical protein
MLTVHVLFNRDRIDPVFTSDFGKKTVDKNIAFIFVDYSELSDFKRRDKDEKE